MSRTVATMCTGGGLFDIGAQKAGYQHIWGIEYDKSIAAVANLNKIYTICADIRAVDYTVLERPSHLHVSPPCPNFSIAKAGATENETDIQLAQAICRALDILQPDTFTLENVVGYRHSVSFKLICDKLSELDYWWDATNLNAADFGVPQTRRRLFIRAKKTFLHPYPAPVKWVGWYTAIEDLIDTLPETQFAPWQLARLPEMYKSFLIGQSSYSRPLDENEPSQTITGNNNQSAIKAFIMSGGGNTNFKDAKPGAGVRYYNQPCHTVSTIDKGGSVPRAFVIDCQNNSNQIGLTIRNGDEPIFTMKSTDSRRPARAAVHGKVVKMTAKALGRFQTVPDDYQGLTIRINGNGVPCLMAQRILEIL